MEPRGGIEPLAILPSLMDWFRRPMRGHGAILRIGVDKRVRMSYDTLGFAVARCNRTDVMFLLD